MQNATQVYGKQIYHVQKTLCFALVLIPGLLVHSAYGTVLHCLYSSLVQNIDSLSQGHKLMLSIVQGM